MHRDLRCHLTFLGTTLERSTGGLIQTLLVTTKRVGLTMLILPRLPDDLANDCFDPRLPFITHTMARASLLVFNSPAESCC